LKSNGLSSREPLFPVFQQQKRNGLLMVIFFFTFSL
jgi:hypothetical protein